MYNTAKELFDDQMEYPTRSTPGLINEMRYIQRLGLSTFENTPPPFTSYNYPPPCRPMICKTLWFPTTKNKAKANPGAVVERFRTLHQQIPTTTLCIYTDGAKSQTSKTTTCAMYIPTRNVSQSWTMDSQASIYSAELIAVHKALDYTYKLDENPPEVRVFCDSSSVVKAIGSTTPGNNETLHQIRETISSLKSSGTQTSLTWIPSHVGIQGNEVADRLAQTECTKPSGAKANHKLSPSEKISIAKAEWRKDHLLYLKTCRKACIQTMSRTGLTKWFHHKERAITVCLHRLRTGHNYLNSFNHRVDKDADPSCREDCEAIENVEHILIDCPYTENHRQKIHQLLATHNIDLNVDSLLGLNMALDTTVQCKIRDTLAKFLNQTNLVNII
ncbi:uncharacterized protein LOC123469924 [Daphnia magna]|uniref:uncharacterized protein LOC123469924 n=1 Tax=Daphnia magna TaxID=35525 RepID=UPI001E1B9F9D|nr:uncharacterized protein LOC123469924 [Daphnia magna]